MKVLEIIIDSGQRGVHSCPGILRGSALKAQNHSTPCKPGLWESIVLGAPAWGAHLLARICPEMEPMQAVTGHQKLLAMVSEDQLAPGEQCRRRLVGE